MRCLPAAILRTNEHIDPPMPTAFAVVPLVQCVKLFATSAPYVLEAFEALVLLFELGMQPGATKEMACGIVLGHEGAEVPITIFQRFDEAEDAAVTIVDGDVLEAQSKAGCG